MSEEHQIDNLLKEAENFLRVQARALPNISRPITLRVQYKNDLRLIDSAKNVFGVQQSFLGAFRETYTDRTYKTIRIHNWEFQLNFIGKKCVKIYLISDHVVFLANKNNKKEINGCHFKVEVADDEDQIKKMSPQMIGYLNRIGKRHLIKQSSNVAKQFKTMISFVPVKNEKIPSFNYKPYAKSAQQINPLSTLNNEGLKVLQKIRHFITRQQINDFLTECQVSQIATEQLKKLIAGDKK